MRDKAAARILIQICETMSKERKKEAKRPLHDISAHLRWFTEVILELPTKNCNLRFPYALI